MSADYLAKWIFLFVSYMKEGMRTSVEGILLVSLAGCFISVLCILEFCVYVFVEIDAMCVTICLLLLMLNSI